MVHGCGALALPCSQRTVRAIERCRPQNEPACDEAHHRHRGDGGEHPAQPGQVDDDRRCESDHERRPHDPPDAAQARWHRPRPSPEQPQRRRDEIAETVAGHQVRPVVLEDVGLDPGRPVLVAEPDRQVPARFVRAGEQRRTRVVGAPVVVGEPGECSVGEAVEGLQRPLLTHPVNDDDSDADLSALRWHGPPPVSRERPFTRAPLLAGCYAPATRSMARRIREPARRLLLEAAEEIVSRSLELLGVPDVLVGLLLVVGQPLAHPGQQGREGTHFRLG